MARAGMTRWRSRNCAPVTDGCDEVQKSLDLLDRVLSEFDDFETGASADGTEHGQLTTTVVTLGEATPVEAVKLKGKDKDVEQLNTPEDENPCGGGQGGHQSEDDGYMSMNGRKAKLMLMNASVGSGSTTSSSVEFTNGDADAASSTPDTPPPPLPLYDRAASRMRQPNGGDFPPPPEEAERIISTLLPRVSPCSSSQRKNNNNRANHSSRNGREFLKSVTLSLDQNATNKLDGYTREGVTIATQTTLPKTKHQRPYGWQKDWGRRHDINSINHQPAVTSSGDPPPKHHAKYGSLPSDGVYYQDVYPLTRLSHAPPTQGVPPRTVAAALDRHREVRRCVPENGRSQEEVALNTVQELADDDPANFSDDSLEDVPSPPPPPSAAAVVAAALSMQSRGSIAWEVSLESDGESVPSSTNAAGRRHKKSADCSSSTGSPGTVNVYDDWPTPLNGKNDWMSRLNSETDANSVAPELNGISSAKKNHFNGGTYVIRKGGRKDRMLLLSEMKTPPQTKYSTSVDETDLKRCSSTFDDIKTLLKEGLVEGLDDSPPDFQPPRPPGLSRGFSLPNIIQDGVYEIEQESKTSFINESVSSMEQLLENDESTGPSTASKAIWTERDKADFVEKQSVAVQVSADFTLLNKEIAEQSTSCQTDNEELNYCVSKAINTAENITSTGTFKRERKTESCEDVDEVDCAHQEVPAVDKKKDLKLEITKQEPVVADTWKSVLSLPEVRKTPACELRISNGFEKPYGDFRVNVEILQHEFGPLPPSPVEEVEDEYADVLQSVPTSNRKSDSLSNDAVHRRNSRLSASGSIRSNRLPDLPSHREANSSLKTRSVDAGFTRNHRTHFLSSSRKEAHVERRTLPTDLPGTSHRRPFQKRSSHSPKEELQQHSSQPHVSCSLPETPIFARGCDIPRTPLRNSNVADKTSSARTTPRLNGIQTSSYMRNVGAGHGTCLGEAMAGAELLRLTGPGRGWYPRHRQPRPASVEHLDRLAPQGLSPSTPAGGVWETREARKPLTLPPNLSPKFFQRSPREALRRVTSLLIRKGGSTKDTKSKNVLASSVIGPHGDFGETTKQQKRGFFRGLWKRSRHYSLDQQQ